MQESGVRVSARARDMDYLVYYDREPLPGRLLRFRRWAPEEAGVSERPALH